MRALGRPCSYRKSRNERHLGSHFAANWVIFHPLRGNLRSVATEVRLSFPDELVRVVGVSHYQDALTAIAGQPGPEGVRRPVTAVLEPEPANPHDANAIRVLVEGRTAGYLSRDDALRYGPAVRLLQDHDRVLVCDAVISGRGPGAETPNLGLFLELPRAPEALLEARTIIRTA